MIRAICLQDLEFERCPVECRTPAGVPFTKWVRVGMPKIGSGVIDGVFYLFATLKDAESGKNPAGSGFIVRAGWSDVYYGVTNWHVAVRDGYSVIRLNKQNGGTDPVELGPENWEFEPGGPDIAITPLNLDPRVHKISSISTFQLADKNAVVRKAIDLGDDVFMVGLFIDHGGSTTNVPSVRFGNISMMPNKDALVKQPTGFMGESFIIDVHSRTGFSGSPVYVYRTTGSDLTQRVIKFREVSRNDSRKRTDLQPDSPLFSLLGIHWGQFPEKWELKEKNELSESAKKNLIIEGAYVEGMSGMTCVIPAWEIMRLLDMPALKKFRDAAAKKKADFSEPKAESVHLSTDESPTHREDFIRLASAAAQKQKQDD
jgi:hypothetical protein